MSFIDYMIIAVVAVLFVLAVYFWLKGRKNGCHGGCAGCNGQCSECMKNCKKK